MRTDRHLEVPAMVTRKSWTCCGCCLLAALVGLIGCGGGSEPGPEVVAETRSGDVIIGAADTTPEIQDLAPADRQLPELQDLSEADDRAGADDSVPPPDTGPQPDLPPPPPDQDNDSIPDAFDPFPNDSSRPGTGSAMSVYMHTADTLWKLDVKSNAITEIGDFVWPSFWESGQMTDIAIDRWGVLYGVTFDDVYTCHPQAVECWNLGALPDTFNGLTLVPQGVIDPDEDVLIGISADGGWYRLTMSNGAVTATQLGSFGGPYASSGDAYSIIDVGTYGAADKEWESDDVLVELNPATGQVIKEVGPLNGYSTVFGLAGWTGKAYAFDAGGDILLVDTATGQTTEVLYETNQPWWGAGVRTLMY